MFLEDMEVLEEKPHNVMLACAILQNMCVGRGRVEAGEGPEWNARYFSLR